jgi:hypothetical protein
LFGNELRATTTSGEVFVHDINDDSGQWTKEDISWLHVAMHQTLLMRVV